MRSFPCQTPPPLSYRYSESIFLASPFALALLLPPAQERFHLTPFTFIAIAIVSIAALSGCALCTSISLV